MDCGRDLSLLSLTGFAELERKIVGYVGTGDNGVQALINFRSVCTTTKSWVEDLPIIHQYKVFTNIQARICYSADRLREYLATPPPTGVAAIFLSDPKNNCVSEVSNEEINLWQQFIESSRDKIIRLEVVNHESFPPNGRLLEILSFKNVKSFKCTSLQFCTDKLEIQKRLLESEDLREFQTQIANADDLDFLVKLIKVNKDKKFYLTVNFKRPQIAIRRGRFRQAMTAFANSIVSSNCSVRLLECRPSDLYNVVQSGVGADAVVEFLKRVESIVNFTSTHDRFWFYYSDFPNLKRVTTSEEISTELEDDWPLQITQMTLNYEMNFNWATFLPESLIYIQLKFQASPINQFLEGMMLLSENCPYLTTVGVKWKCTNQDNDEDFCEERIVFENLRCLMLEVTVPENVGKAVAHNMVTTLQIDALPLEMLQFIVETHDTDPIENVLEEEILVKLTEGEISKSLFKFQAERKASEVRMSREPRRLMKQLIATAAENKRKKVESGGKKQLSLHLDLDSPQFGCNLLQIKEGKFRFSE